MIRTSTTWDPPGLAWFKSSYSSSGDGNDCVEIAVTPSTIRVRDSKNVEGPRLILAPGAWDCFVSYASER